MAQIAPGPGENEMAQAAAKKASQRLNDMGVPQCYLPRRAARLMSGREPPARSVAGFALAGEAMCEFERRAGAAEEREDPERGAPERGESPFPVLALFPRWP